VVIDPSDYDWEGDKSLHRPMEDTIVYETHVQVAGRARAVDTSLPSPSDIVEPGAETVWPEQSYLVKPRSVVVLFNTAV
jgi:hypothetical protein